MVLFSEPVDLKKIIVFKADKDRELESIPQQSAFSRRLLFCVLAG